MNKIAIVLILLVGSLRAMNEEHKNQITREHKHIEVLRSFEKEDFIKSKKSPEQVQAILADLKGVRPTAGYNKLMNQGLLALAKKSEVHGNLEYEMPIARKLVEAGAIIPFTQTIEVSCNKPSEMGHPAILKTESTLAIACGDLKEFLDAKWQEVCSEVEWAEDTDIRGYLPSED